MKKIFPVLICLLPLFSTAQDLVLVLNKQSHTLSFVDVKTMTSVKEIPTGFGPHEIAISPDKKFAFVANYGSDKNGNTIDIFDIKKKEKIKTIDLSFLQRPHGLQVVGTKLYFTLEYNRCVGRYDYEKDKIDWLAGTGESVSHMLAVMNNQSKLYTADIMSGTVTCIAPDMPPLPQYIKKIKVGNKPEAIELTPDNQELWVGHNESGMIYMINTVSNQVMDSIKAGMMPIRIKFNKDGSKAYITDPPANEVIEVDVKKHAVLRRLKLSGAPVGLIFDDQSTFLYVALTKENRFAKIDLSTFEVVSYAGVGVNPDGIGYVSL